MLTEEEQLAVVAEANLAPSVHNTQPVRWSFLGTKLRLRIDASRRLPVGDPSGRDAALSLGAALEGTILALGRRGFSADVVPGEEGVLSIASGGLCLDLTEQVFRRRTWRGHFTPMATAGLRSLESEMCHVITDSALIGEIAAANDQLSAQFFLDRPYREELVSYLRLFRDHPKWSEDGLNRHAMKLSLFEAMAANILLREPAFSFLKRLGLVDMVSSEGNKTRTASAVVFLSMPLGGSAIEAGRQLYRTALRFTELDFYGWPMAVLVDDEQMCSKWGRHFGIDGERTLYHAWRLGGVDESATRPEPARIPPERLIDPVKEF